MDMGWSRYTSGPNNFNLKTTCQISKSVNDGTLQDEEHSFINFKEILNNCLNNKILSLCKTSKSMRMRI